jgi:predicted nucleic acid-binding protein
MSAVAFDNTMLSILLNPDGRIPYVEGTATPVDLAKDRAEHVVATIQKQRRKIIIPAPACAELLTAIGPTAQQYINLVSRSRIFEIGNFDARGAAELALLNRDTFHHQDRNNGAEPYQKIKVDRQIIAICRVHGVTEIYTDDKGLAKGAALCGITPIKIADCPIPDSARQGRLKLEQHEELPEPEEEMPPKEEPITDAERSKRIRETASEIGTSDDPETFERAVSKVVKRVEQPEQRAKPKKSGSSEAS